MNYCLVINGLVSIEAASRSLLNIRTMEHYGVDISEYQYGVAQPVRGSGYKVDYYRIENKNK